MSSIRFRIAAAAAAIVVALFAAAVPAEDAPAQGGEKPKFVGDTACKKCHLGEHRSWKKGAMAQAMESLKPTTEAADKALFDKKKAAGLDPAKDYTTDATCLPCHTTGYGEAGGYPKDPTKDDEAKELAAKMGSVSCEACHGAGEKYVEFKKAEIAKSSEAKFTREQLLPYGIVVPDAKACETCHNDRNPTKGELKFEEDKAKVHPK